MTLDLTHLRRVTEAAIKDSPFRSEEKQTAAAYDAWFDAWREFRNTVTPDVFVQVLDRLERAEQKLAERETVYPSLMTQVREDPPMQLSAAVSPGHVSPAPSAPWPAAPSFVPPKHEGGEEGET